MEIKTPILFLLLLVISPSPSLAEIKTLKISSDSRPLILFEKFGFTTRGQVSITVSDVSFTSALAGPDPSLLGFVLLSDEGILQAIYDSQSPNPNPRCVLSSTYVRKLFTFTDLAPNSYNYSFPVSHPDEYNNLFFANCAPENQVSMSVRTEMSRDFLSVGQSLYSLFVPAYDFFVAAKIRLSAHLKDWVTWSFLSEIVGCCMIIIPIAWSFRLDKYGRKATREVRILRKIYVMVVGHIYLLKIVTFATIITVDKDGWVSLVVSLALYVFIFYMVSSKVRVQDDEEEEARGQGRQFEL